MNTCYFSKKNFGKKGSDYKVFKELIKTFKISF